jgi:hypothetical protein
MEKRMGTMYKLIRKYGWRTILKKNNADIVTASGGLAERTRLPLILRQMGGSILSLGEMALLVAARLAASPYPV